MAPFNDTPPPGGPAERLSAARYVLIAAAALFVAAAFWFGVPVIFTLGGIALLLLVAAFVPPRRTAAQQRAAGTTQPAAWPDAAATATVGALAHPGFILDPAGIVRFVNRHAAARFPTTREGDPFVLTFRMPEFAEAVGEARGGRERAVELRLPGETGSVYSVRLSPVRLSGDAVTFILITFEDVSERIAVARMRADFVANASHELRTPLASLTGFIETLLGAARNDPAASEKFLRVMLDQARRMRRLIDDLLSLSRAEMRVHSRPTERADLVAVLRHVGDALAPLAAEQSVVLTIDAPAASVEVIGERDELVQVFQNLVENGIRYGASGGRVEVRLETDAQRDRVRTEVRDFGPGIAPEHLPRLTERFYRVDAGASREMKGTGLGLAIVKHILTRHGGELDVKSEIGRGASFTVTLPLPGGGARREVKTV
jgi:two-component system phosphate regulon sensor histidine kinase PhoR